MEIEMTLVTFLLTVLGHAALMRCRLPGSSVVRFIFSMVGGCSALLAALAYFTPFVVFHAITCVLIFGFLCELYLFVFTLVSSSISAKLLRTLSQRTMNPAEIRQLYDAEEMVKKRFQRMQAGGLYDGNSEKITERGRRFAWFFGSLMRFLRLDALPEETSAHMITPPKEHHDAGGHQRLAS